MLSPVVRLAGFFTKKANSLGFSAGAMVIVIMYTFNNLSPVALKFSKDCSMFFRVDILEAKLPVS